MGQMDMREALGKLTAAHGTSGREYGAAACGAELLAPYGQVSTDTLGNVLLAREGNAPEKAEHITLTAHLDEIGMMVREIDGKGYLKIAAVGGLDRRGLMGQEVLVLADEPVYGVVCSVPPHLTSSDDRKKLLEMDDMAIDIGYPKEEAEKHVSIGDWAVVLAPLVGLQNGMVSGKALDDRAGCASLLWALDKLKGASLNCNVTVVFAAMEEIGSQGARTAHYAAGATHAIAVDVTFGFAHGDKPHCPKMGSGAAIGFAPILNPKMSKALVEAAKRHDIPYTTEVMGGRTGTDADAIHTSGSGVVTGLLSIPERYMHSPVEVIDPEDVKAVGDLIAAYIIDTWGTEN